MTLLHFGGHTASQLPRLHSLECEWEETALVTEDDKRREHNRNPAIKNIQSKCLGTLGMFLVRERKRGRETGGGGGESNCEGNIDFPNHGITQIVSRMIHMENFVIRYMSP